MYCGGGSVSWAADRPMTSEEQSGTRLPREFFARSTIEVARDLIGVDLVSRLDGGETRGRIVEAEAYRDASDPASHAARLRRGRVEAMSGLPGIAYIYRSYGFHTMLNVVCEPAGQTGAILIRALEPLVGIDLMRKRRGIDDCRLLCSGPGRLCQAMGIGMDDHGLDLVTSDQLWFEFGAAPAQVMAGPRIGISRGTEAPWRFFAAGNRFVSAHRRGTLVQNVVPSVEEKPPHRSQ